MDAKEMKNKLSEWISIHFDFHSIRFKLFITFMAFTAVLLLLIWCLQIFFLNDYYETMKEQETSRIANHIVAEFNANGNDMSALARTIREESRESDLTILIGMKGSSNFLNLAPKNSSISTSYSLNNDDMRRLLANLESSEFSGAMIRTRDGANRQTLGFARYLGRDNEYILLVTAPLSPLKSTISIIRSQLVYISFLAIILALFLAFYFASRISRPLKEITWAAAEMGRGNYGVKFRGGHYTEITELADTLTHTENELEKTDMYQKDLIANVSHDLRTPLTMIKSYAEMIRDLSGDNPAKRTAHLEVIIEETDRLNSLVNDMLNLSRIQNRTITLEKSSFDLGEAAESILPAYRILEESDGYQIDYLAEHGPYPVNADEQKIKQVMNNLLTNAVKYCGDDKYIAVMIQKMGHVVRFSVTDHGQGIAPDEINHVWERYYKSSTHHVRSADGTGLGLSIVKEILNLHKADYDVDSELGEGSTFWFELPLEKVRS